MISHTIHGHTALVIIDNPPANTWTPESLKALKALTAELSANRAVYAAVITGAGEKFFSAGADLKRFKMEGPVDKVNARAFIAAFGEAFEAWMNARFVTIAAINGYAMGGGLECALSCDIRIAESHAQLALPEPAVGLLPAGCGTQNLPWLVGEGWAKRIILTNERVNAETALRIGLVEEVVEKGKAREAALAMAERVAALSPKSVEFCKSLIHNARNGIPRRAGLALERERFMDLFEYSDQNEGVTAFLDKRKPVWKNEA
jgi:enoyl-CoA hydratase/carnithine racemase